jgi:hypothetical protein
MKRFITILIFASLAFLANAQHRIQPVIEVTEKTYEEVLNLMNMMERVVQIERIEKIKLDANHTTTYGGEFLLIRDVHSINIFHSEFSNMLNKHLADPNRSWYDPNAIRTELHLQHAKLFEYLSRELQGNHRIKSMYIIVEPKSGASYIRVNYHRL